MDKVLRIQVLLGAIDKLTRPLKAVREESSRVSAALRTTRDRVRELSAQRAKIDGFRQAKIAAGELRDKLTEARARATQLGKAFAETDKPTRKLSADFKAAKKDLADLEGQERSNQTTLNRLRSELGQAGQSTTALARHEVALRRDIHQATEELDRQKRALEGVAAKTRRLQEAEARREKVQALSGRMASGGMKSMAVGAGLATPFVIAGKAAVDYEARLANVRKIMDFTNREAAQLAKAGIAKGIAPGGMADIAAQGAMGGVPRGELIAFSKDAALMKEALNFDSAQEAGEMASGWRHAFNMKQDQVRQLGDVVTALTRKWGAKGGKGGEIAQMLANVGTIAQVAGSGVNQTAALASVLSSMNVEVGVASTGIRNLMINLTRGAAATGAQKKAWKALGMDAKTVAADMQKDAGAAIVGVLEKVRALPRAQQAGVLTQLFGARSIGPMGSLLERLDRVKDALHLAGDASQTAGQMQVEFSRKTNTTSFRLQQAKANAENLAITVGTQLLPTIDRLAGFTGRLLARLTAWSAAHPKLTKAITMTAVGLSGLLLIGGALTLAISALLGPLIAVNLAFAEGTIGAGAFTAAAGLFAGLGPIIGGAFAAMAAGALEFGAALLLNPITWIVLGIGLLAAGAFLVVKNWATISGFFGGLWDRVKTIFGGVMAWFGGLGATFAGYGRNLMQGLINGVLGMIGAVGKAIAGVGGTVVDFFKQKLGIRSPSRVFALLGEQTMAGLELGLNRSRRGPLRSVAAVAAGLAFSTSAGLVVSGSASSGGGAGGGGSVHHHRHGPTTIQIVAAPGESPHSIAQAVARAMEERERAAASRRRGALADYD